MRAGRIVRAIFACLGLASILSGCNTDDVYLREGAGIELFSRNLPETTQLQEAYVAYICAQSGFLNSTIDGVLICDQSGFGPVQWSLFVQAGMNDIDQRCDSYLSWLDNKKRWAAPVLQQISDVRTATEAIMVATGATGPYPIGIVGAAFGLASRTFTNINSRLVLELNHSTVQALVLSRQRRYRQQLLGDAATGLPPIAIVSRPAAIHALRSYLRLCMPFTIETEINTTITDIERGGVAAVINNQPLINAETVRTAVIGDVRRPLPSEGGRLPGLTPEAKARIFADQLANSLCVPLTGKTKDESVKDFFVGRGLVPDTAKTPITRVPSPSDPKKNLNIDQVLQNVTASIGDCKKKQFRNAYEVGRFGVTSDQSQAQVTQSVDDLQSGLRKRLGRPANDLTSGKLDVATRKAITEFREKNSFDKALGDQVDSRLVSEVTKELLTD